MRMMDRQYTLTRKPQWLKVSLPRGNGFIEVKKTIQAHHLNTVCVGARCPNIADCWGRHTATFMIMGSQCTRQCSFCAVQNGIPKPLDESEPRSVAEAAFSLGLQYIVVTSVTRDDLGDGGANHFAQTIAALREKSPQCKVEILIPDFGGNSQALRTVFFAKPDVLNHNVETVKQLYSKVRPQADYRRSLNVLQQAVEHGLLCKSGLMVGLGESTQQIVETMLDLLKVGCKMLTIGQYLQPNKKRLPVHRFVHPEEFLRLKQQGLQMGFTSIAAGPLVRSSYHAEQQFQVKVNPGGQ
jgi:lipoic acid synthetase